MKIRNHYKSEKGETELNILNNNPHMVMRQIKFEKNTSHYRTVFRLHSEKLKKQIERGHRNRIYTIIIWD